jgi:hypothetical protein
MKPPHRATDGKVRCAIQDRWIKWRGRHQLLELAEREFAERPSRSNARSVERARHRRDRLKPPPPYETWDALEADMRASFPQCFRPPSNWAPAPGERIAGLVLGDGARTFDREAS